MTAQPVGSGFEDTSASRGALLDTLRRSGRPMTVQELADALRLHKSSVRFHLARLVRSGLIHEERAVPTGPGRPRLVYSLATTGATGGGAATMGGTGGGAGRAGGYQILAEALSEHLAHASPHPDEVAMDAGEKQGRRIVPRDPEEPPATEDEGRQLVTTLMRDYGFDPDWDPDGDRLWLHTCPLRPVSDDYPAVTCSLHLGLLRGTLEAAAAPLEVASLDRASAPYPCLATFRKRVDVE